MLMEKLEAVHNSKQMYKEKWAILVRDVQKVRYENGSVSNESTKYELQLSTDRRKALIIMVLFVFTEWKTSSIQLAKSWLTIKWIYVKSKPNYRMCCDNKVFLNEKSNILLLRARSVGSFSKIKLNSTLDEYQVVTFVCDFVRLW